MKNEKNINVKLALFVIFFAISGLGHINAKKLEITFKLNSMENFVPSNQLVIWVEKPDSSYVKTMFISEYLSYGGYNLPEICSRWSAKSNWEETTAKEFDAVTSATPAIGEVKLKVKCPADLIPDGKYTLFIEVHLVDDYNELYSGELIVSKKKYQTNLKVTYKPGKYLKSAGVDILSDVQVICK